MSSFVLCEAARRALRSCHVMLFIYQKSSNAIDSNMWFILVLVSSLLYVVWWFITLGLCLLEPGVTFMLTMVFGDI